MTDDDRDDGLTPPELACWFVLAAVLTWGTLATVFG